MNAEYLNAWFDGLTAARIRAMKGTEQENLRLDFKVPSEQFNSKDDPRILAKALSGFANAAGGVIVWGVDARKDKSADHIDQVVGVPGLKKPQVILSRLTELTSQACSPVPAGIQHRILKARTGHPFVATLVPESASGPHMARLGEDRYYVRAGGSFMRMEHFQLADMFGRRARPVLAVETLVDQRNPPSAVDHPRFLTIVGPSATR